MKNPDLNKSFSNEQRFHIVLKFPQLLKIQTAETDIILQRINIKNAFHLNGAGTINS